LIENIVKLFEAKCLELAFKPDSYLIDCQMMVTLCYQLLGALFGGVWMLASAHVLHLPIIKVQLFHAKAKS